MYVVEILPCRGEHQGCRGEPWERTHVVEDTMGVVDNADHVVEVCRGERCRGGVSWAPP